MQDTPPQDDGEIPRETTPGTSNATQPPRKRQKFTRTRGVGCETCRRRKKKCNGIDTIFKTCLGCRKNGLLCLPWGSDHPQFPANGAAPQNMASSRSHSQVSHEREEEVGESLAIRRRSEDPSTRVHDTSTSSRSLPSVHQAQYPVESYQPVPPSVVTAPYQRYPPDDRLHSTEPYPDHQISTASAAPLPPPLLQTDPDFDPQITYAGLDAPMSPNTAAIWMALIQYTEPVAPSVMGYPQEGGESSVGRLDLGSGVDLGYDMLGTGVSLAPARDQPSRTQASNEVLTMEYALDPRTDLRKHPHTQQLLDLYLEIADCWLPTFPPGSNNPIRSAVEGLHDSPASVCVRSALASAYIRCVRPSSSENGLANGREGSQKELPKPLSVDLERLFIDTAITSISANPPDLSLSNKLWCIIDLQLYYFTHSSAFQGMEVMKMAEDIIHQEFGESPELVMSLLYRQQTFGARIFALGDISRCLLDRGRRCVFDLIGKNDEDPHIPASMALGAYDSNWVSGNAWLGMPMSIGVQLASIVDLVADIKDAENEYGRSRNVPTRIKEGFRDRGFAIEQRVRKKDFTRSAGDGVGVGEPPIGVVLGDLWKATALTVLYQSVFDYGPLHPHLRQALVEMRRTLNITFQHSYRSPPPSHLPHLFGYLSCPVFFAGTLAITPEDRQWVRRMLERLGPEQAWRDNRVMLEGMWREMDDKGWAVEWHDYMARNELWVGFY